MSSRCFQAITVEIRPPEKIEVIVGKNTHEVIEVGMVGIQGPPGKDATLEALPVDPLQIYLEARGELSNAHNPEHSN